MHESRSVVFAGGGTGGHLYPALALAEALVSLRPDVAPFFIGATRGIEARVLPERGVPHALLPVRGVARGRILENLSVGPALLRSMERTRELFRCLRPELVVVTGGYAAAPAGLMAALGGIPLAIQEQNAYPGWTTRGLSRWAEQIHLGFPEAEQRLPRAARAVVVDRGNPIRDIPEVHDRARALGEAGYDPKRRLVLVVGGSQGSAALNGLLSECAAGIAEGGWAVPADVQILWATGPRHFDDIHDALPRAGVPEWLHMVPYIEDMPQLLPLASLAVSRAGAMTTSEFLAAGVPSILVPLPSSAAGHQAKNAEALEAAGAALVADEVATCAADVWRTMTDLLSDTVRLASMSDAARVRARPAAARDIAEDLSRLLPPMHGGAS